MTDAQFNALKREVEDAKAKAERAQGAREQLMKRLKSEFGCSSTKEARAKLERLEQERRDAEAAFNKASTAYEKKWKTNQRSSD